MIDPAGRKGRIAKRVAVGSCAGLLVVAIPASVLAAEYTGKLPVFQDDFGGTGLMEVPSARPEEVGDFYFNFSHASPYSNYAFSFQPFSWLQAGFRYTSISNRSYGKVAPDRDYLDKGFGIKFILTDEGRYMPQVALGFRDLGGTGLFTSEYLVGNKRWHNFDFTLGLGWGYLGNKGRISNPLDLISDHFKDRDDEYAENGGKFNVKQWFTGRPSFFGGIQYTTPWRPLTLQVEYEGHDSYKEPKGNHLKRDFPLNFGARYKLNDNVTLSAAYLRGNTLMLGATLGVNFAHLTQPKSDPPPVAVKSTDNNQPDPSWNAVAKQLHDNAGIDVSRISRQGDALVVDGEPVTYRYLGQSELRGNRILHNAAGQDIQSFQYRWQQGGFFLRDDTLPRAPLPEEPMLVKSISPFVDLDYRHGIVSSTIDRQSAKADAGETLYEKPQYGFSYSIGPDLNYNYGGPDGFLFQALASANFEFQTDQHGWFSGQVGYALFNNLDKLDYRAPSKLPRVRTDITEYMRHTHLGVYNLQYTRTMRLSDNVFGMVYGGLLEQMYGGVGGEVLYRPFNSNVAFGADINWVKQRDFDTQFDFRDYSTVEGHATAYVDTGIADVLAKLSVGRYLAGDYGTTIDLSRTFDSGVTIGAYAVFTTAGDDYGEGSFNKGIYLSMPFDIFFTKSSRSHVQAFYSPLTRDGGASLARRYNLYSLTGTRVLNRYWEGFQKRD